ncbi:MAG: hypothetical protein KAS75_07190 [Planctomycetes bacterium]|nr:hypothetical protein [Planctomycetota bacterium]
MNATYGIKKYSADKIAFLAILIITLLLAQLIIVSKSGVSLSKPIILDGTGLSVPVPAGGGWQSVYKWEYNDNAFTLSSIFVPYSTTATTLAYCKYLLAPTAESLDARFEQKALAVEGQIAKTGTTNTDYLSIDWVYIKREKPLFDLFFGTVKLPNNRQLDIEVHQTTGDTALAERTFEAIVENLRFEDNQLLEAGSEIIAGIKGRGLDSLLKNQSPQRFFLIKDARKHIIGFLTETLTELSQESRLNIRVTSFYYLRDRRPVEQVTSFQSNTAYDEFIWKSETANRIGRTKTEVTLDKTGIMTVRNFGVGAEDENFPLGGAAVPEILLDFVFSQMFQSSREKFIIDIIQPDGTITPALISKDETQQTPYALKLQLLDGSGFFEKVYLDDQMQISKAILQQDTVYLLERTDKETVLAQFPERADYLLQRLAH